MARRPISPTLRRGIHHGAHGASLLGYRVLSRALRDWRRVQVTRNVPYRPTGRRDHFLDIFRLRNSPHPQPTILYVHGGAFSMMSKDTHQIMAYTLASQGYQVFNINYRLAPPHRYPRPLEDVTAALHWTLENGAEYGADTSRVALMGESAGANLVAALTYCATHPRPEPFARSIYERAPGIRCALPMYGVHDLNDMERLWRKGDKGDRMAAWIKHELEWTARSYIGYPISRTAPNAPLASPLRLYQQPAGEGARPLPPFFTAVGTADPLLADSVELTRALEARGTPCELHVFPGEMHAFNAFLWRPAARSTWTRCFAFLRKHLDPDLVTGPALASAAPPAVTSAP